MSESSSTIPLTETCMSASRILASLGLSAQKLMQLRVGIQAAVLTASQQHSRTHKHARTRESPCARASKTIQYKILTAHLHGLVSIRCLMCPRCTKLNQIASYIYIIYTCMYIYIHVTCSQADGAGRDSARGNLLPLFWVVGFRVGFLLGCVSRRFFGQVARRRSAFLKSRGEHTQTSISQ